MSSTRKDIRQSLEILPRRDLQAMAKANDVQGNMKSSEIVDELVEILYKSSRSPHYPSNRRSSSRKLTMDDDSDSDVQEGDDIDEEESEESEESDEKEVVIVKRGPGRPPKNPTNTATPSKSTQNATTTPSKNIKSATTPSKGPKNSNTPLKSVKKTSTTPSKSTRSVTSTTPTRITRSVTKVVRKKDIIEEEEDDSEEDSESYDDGNDDNIFSSSHPHPTSTPLARKQGRRQTMTWKTPNHYNSDYNGHGDGEDDINVTRYYDIFRQSSSSQNDFDDQDLDNHHGLKSDQEEMVKDNFTPTQTPIQKRKSVDEELHNPNLNKSVVFSLDDSLVNLYSPQLPPKRAERLSKRGLVDDSNDIEIEANQQNRSSFTTNQQNRHSFNTSRNFELLNSSQNNIFNQSRIILSPTATLSYRSDNSLVIPTQFPKQHLTPLQRRRKSSLHTSIYHDNSVLDAGNEVIMMDNDNEENNQQNQQNQQNQPNRPNYTQNELNQQNQPNRFSPSQMNTSLSKSHKTNSSRHSMDWSPSDSEGSDFDDIGTISRAKAHNFDSLSTKDVDFAPLPPKNRNFDQFSPIADKKTSRLTQQHDDNTVSMLMTPGGTGKYSNPRRRTAILTPNHAKLTPNEHIAAQFAHAFNKAIDLTQNSPHYDEMVDNDYKSTTGSYKGSIIDSYKSSTGSIIDRIGYKGGHGGSYKGSALVDYKNVLMDEAEAELNHQLDDNVSIGSYHPSSTRSRYNNGDNISVVLSQKMIKYEHTLDELHLKKEQIFAQQQKLHLLEIQQNQLELEIKQQAIDLYREQRMLQSGRKSYEPIDIIIDEIEDDILSTLSRNSQNSIKMSPNSKIDQKDHFIEEISQETLAKTLNEFVTSPTPKSRPMASSSLEEPQYQTTVGVSKPSNRRSNRGRSGLFNPVINPIITNTPFISLDSDISPLVTTPTHRSSHDVNAVLRSSHNSTPPRDAERVVIAEEDFIPPPMTIKNTTQFTPRGSRRKSSLHMPLLLNQRENDVDGEGNGVKNSRDGEPLTLSFTNSTDDLTQSTDKPTSPSLLKPKKRKSTAIGAGLDDFDDLDDFDERLNQKRLESDRLMVNDLENELIMMTNELQKPPQRSSLRSSFSSMKQKQLPFTTNVFDDDDDDDDEQDCKIASTHVTKKQRRTTIFNEEEKSAKSQQNVRKSEKGDMKRSSIIDTALTSNNDFINLISQIEYNLENDSSSLPLLPKPTVESPSRLNNMRRSTTTLSMMTTAPSTTSSTISQKKSPSTTKSTSKSPIKQSSIQAMIMRSPIKVLQNKSPFRGSVIPTTTGSNSTTTTSIKPTATSKKHRSSIFSPSGKATPKKINPSVVNKIITTGFASTATATNPYLSALGKKGTNSTSTSTLASRSGFMAKVDAQNKDVGANVPTKTTTTVTPPSISTTSSINTTSPTKSSTNLKPMIPPKSPRKTMLTMKSPQKTNVTSTTMTRPTTSTNIPSSSSSLPTKPNTNIPTRPQSNLPPAAQSTKSSLPSQQRKSTFTGKPTTTSSWLTKPTTSSSTGAAKPTTVSATTTTTTSMGITKPTTSGGSSATISSNTSNTGMMRKSTVTGTNLGGGRQVLSHLPGGRQPITQQPAGAPRSGTNTTHTTTTTTTGRSNVASTLPSQQYLQNQQQQRKTFIPHGGAK